MLRSCLQPTGPIRPSFCTPVWRLCSAKVAAGECRGSPFRNRRKRDRSLLHRLHVVANSAAESVTKELSQRRVRLFPITYSIDVCHSVGQGDPTVIHVRFHINNMWRHCRVCTPSEVAPWLGIVRKMEVRRNSCWVVRVRTLQT